MTKTVTTNVTIVSVNHIDEDEAERLATQAGYEDIGKYAQSLEESVEAIVATQLFGDADDIPILDVSTDVYDDWDEDDANALAQ